MRDAAVSRGPSWRAAVEATGRARAAWDGHKPGCAACSGREPGGLCAPGRELLHELWARQRAQSDAWHAKAPRGAGMEPLF